MDASRLGYTQPCTYLHPSTWHPVLWGSVYRWVSPQPWLYHPGGSHSTVCPNPMSPCSRQCLHTYFLNEWVSMPWGNEWKWIILSGCLGCYHWGQSSKMFKSCFGFLFPWVPFLLNINFEYLSLWSLYRNLIFCLPSAGVIMSDFGLQCHSVTVQWDPTQSHSHTSPRQLTHEDMSLSGLWLFIEIPAQEGLPLQFSPALSLGVLNGPCR